MKLNNFSFLKEYTEAFGPSCFETPAQAVMKRHIGNLHLNDEYSQLTIDGIGNLILDINKKKRDIKKTIAFFAHVDEISFYVTNITDGGVYVAKRTGDYISAISSKIVILNSKFKPVEGLLNYAASAVRNSIDEDYIFVEILEKNNSAKDIRQKHFIHEGSPLVYTTVTNLYNENKIIGKALDNRLGGYLITEVLDNYRRMFPAEYETTRFIFANLVQEEIGGNGAHYISKNYKDLSKVDVSFVIDATHDFTAFGTAVSERRLHANVGIDKGPVITLSPLSNYDIFRNSISKLDSNNIKYQIRSKMKNSWTDLDKIYINNFKGILIQFPVRYMHSSYELASQSDISIMGDALLKLI